MKSQLQNPKTAEPTPPFPAQTQDAPGSERQLIPHADYGRDSYVGHGRLEGRIALITGGDSGIGRAVALAFAREGAHVAIAFLPEESHDAHETEEAILSSGRQALLVPGNLADTHDCARLVARVVERFGHIDILVNNAAFQGKALENFEDFDDARLEHTLRVNLLAPFLLVRQALPHMRPGSSIINVASVQAYNPSSNIIDYATTKGGLVTFTKGLAPSLIDRGIRVNCVAPGPVWTPLIAQSFDEKKVSEFGTNFPMERPAQPKELAPAFVFLASDESRYVNGEVLGVTGGRALG